jgi:hypothetical protein
MPARRKKNRPERADLHPTYLGGVERGEQNVNNLSKVATALHVRSRPYRPFKTTIMIGSRNGEAILVGEQAGMDLFISAFCSRCKYLNGFIRFEGKRDPFLFCSVFWANCEPFIAFRDFTGG